MRFRGSSSLAPTDRSFASAFRQLTLAAFVLLISISPVNADAVNIHRANADPVGISTLPTVTPDLGRYFGGIPGTFVLLDARTGRRLRRDPARAARRFPPASTFKIANTLIALETGVIAGPDTVLVRDPDRAPRQAWWPAAWGDRHTLRSALAGSVVWYYQELARRIGLERMQAYVDRFDYGNRDLSGGIDRFWLTGGLRISADEQVDFLRRFHFGELDISARNTRITKELLVLEQTPGYRPNGKSGYRLSGKTGWAGLGEPGAPQTGWLVGTLERGREVYFFATRLDLRSDQDAAARLPITKAILRALGLLENGEGEHRPGH